MTGFSFTLSGTPPGPMQATFGVDNRGQPAGGAFDVSLYLSDDVMITAADLFLAKARVTFGLGDGIGGVIDFTLPPVDPFVTDNHYWVGMLVDSSGEIAELDEANNSGRGNEIDMSPVYSEPELASPDGAVRRSTDSAGPGPAFRARIGDGWIGPYDQDLFQVDANASERLSFDLDSTGAASTRTSASTTNRGACWPRTTVPPPRANR